MERGRYVHLIEDFDKNRKLRGILEQTMDGVPRPARVCVLVVTVFYNDYYKHS